MADKPAGIDPDLISGVLLDRFVIPMTVYEITDEAIAEPIRPIVLAFVANMRSITRAAGSPFLIVSAATTAKAFDKAVSDERKKRGLADEPMNLETFKLSMEAHQEAEKQFSARIASTDGHVEHMNENLAFLKMILGMEEVRSAADELIFQAATASWTAFEVLARDLIRAYLNAHPQAAVALMEDKQTKGRFGIKIELDDLVRHGFDLSRGMGTLLVQRQDFSDYLTIKKVCDVLFQPCRSLEPGTHHDRLLKLNRQRNLIVHKRGLADQTYIDQTGDQLALGDRISVTPPDLIKYFLSCQIAGLGLIQEFSAVI